jgi:hypothetical protein
MISAVSPVFSGVADGQTSKTRAHVETLASPRLEGRLTGSNGEKLAGDYLVSELQKIGAKPLPGQKDFLLPFEFTSGTKDSGSSISLRYDTKNGVESGVVFGTTRGSAGRPVRALRSPTMATWKDQSCSPVTASSPGESGTSPTTATPRST